MRGNWLLRAPRRGRFESVAALATDRDVHGLKMVGCGRDSIDGQGRTRVQWWQNRS